MLRASDVALEMPPGAGKTLVGGVIGEWRRRKFGERVVYASATKGLANQAAAKLSGYGANCVLLTGSHRDWSEADTLKYRSAQAIAVTTYWSVFNSNPPLDDAELLILDDAHAAEGAVAGPWSISIERTDAAYRPLLQLLASTLDPLIVERLLAPSGGGSSANDIHLASAVGVAEHATEIAATLRQAVQAGGVADRVKYVMRLVEDHFDRMLIYVSWRSILIRPFIPPTATLTAFEGPTQRLYMSATLGDGGELERAFGRRKISRLPVPSGWDRRGNGRRFFAFPESTSDLARADAAAKMAYIKQVITKFGRAVVLTPDSRTMEGFLATCVPDGADVFRPEDVEDSLDGFAATPRAVLAMANRYDGLDLPDESCRLVILAGLPARGDLQERFLAKGLGAIDVLQERIRARITQGAGRATRNPTDYAAVLMLGSELTSFAARRDVQQALHPELHAELKFGLTASLENTSSELLDLFDHFLGQSPAWIEADETIKAMRDDYNQVTPAGTAELSDAAAKEVAAWQHLWEGEWTAAREAAKATADIIRRSRASQRYAALWNYKLGSWTTIEAGGQPTASTLDAARAAFSAARVSARGTTWLSRLESPADRRAMTGSEREIDPLDEAAISQAAQTFDRLQRPNVYNPLIGQIKTGLRETASTPFEKALVSLGELAGASSSVGDGGGTAKPDASWDFSGAFWVTWEAKSNAQPETEISVSTIDQTNRHPLSMADRLNAPIPSGSMSILTTPQLAFDAAAPGVAEDHSYWVTIEFVQELADRLDLAWRTIKTSLAPSSNDAERRRVILEAFNSQQVLPTQWLAKPKRIRVPESDQ